MNDNQLGNLLLSGLGTGAQLYGQQNAGQAVEQANLNAINNQKSYLGNIQGIYQPQKALGDQSMSDLSSLFGSNGQPANYSNFLNMPGYQFAVQQGTQALQRQASAMGSAYTPNTAAAVGQYVTGTAMQDYNTYVQQLLSGAQLGSQANQGLSSATYNTGANTSQLIANIGQAQAGVNAGQGQTIAGALGGGGFNSSGVAGGLGSLVKSGLGYLGKGLSSFFGGSSGGGTANTGDANGLNPGNNYGSYGYSGTGNIFGSDTTSDPNTYVDPNTGGTTTSFNDSTSYDPTTGW